MVKYTLEQYVNAPRERVFATATDLRHAPEFISGIQSLEVLTDGPIRKGTRFRETRLMFKRPATAEMEITSFDPPRGYDVACEEHGCAYATRFRFEPKGSGTNVVMDWEAVPRTVVARVMSVIFAPLMKSCMKLLMKDLQEIGHAAEANARPGS